MVGGWPARWGSGRALIAPPAPARPAAPSPHESPGSARRQTEEKKNVNKNK
jgi:hypothetical protein